MYTHTHAHAHAHLVRMNSFANEIGRELYCVCQSLSHTFIHSLACPCFPTQIETKGVEGMPVARRGQTFMLLLSPSLSNERVRGGERYEEQEKEMMHLQTLYVCMYFFSFYMVCVWVYEFVCTYVTSIIMNGGVWWKAWWRMESPNWK